jgi:hypothetical protein
VAAPATCPGRTENTCPSLSHSLASADLVWVVDNTIVGNGRSGILIGAAGSTTVNEATIVNNVVAFNSLPGIQSYFPPGTIVGRRDEAYRNVGFGNPSGDFVEWVGGGIDYSRGNIVGDPLCRSREPRLPPPGRALDRALPGYAEATTTRASCGHRALCPTSDHSNARLRNARLRQQTEGQRAPRVAQAQACAGTSMHRPFEQRGRYFVTREVT